MPQNNTKIIERKSLKNKRKPTDILIFTDGSLVSAAAFFIKNYQYYGGGMVVRYFGNPYKSNFSFDSVQSSGIIMREKFSLLRSPQGYRELVIRYNIKMDMP